MHEFELIMTGAHFVEAHDACRRANTAYGSGAVALLKELSYMIRLFGRTQY